MQASEEWTPWKTLFWLVGAIATGAFLGWLAPILLPGAYPVASTQTLPKHFALFHDGIHVESLAPKPAAPPVQRAAEPPPVLSAAEEAIKALAARGGTFNEESFVHAARRGSLEDLALYVTAGMQPTVCDAAGHSALTAALENAELNAAEFLIKAGADPNAPDLRGEFPVTAAIASKNPKAVQAVLKLGANISADPVRARIADCALATANGPTIHYALDLLPDGMRWSQAARDYLFAAIRLRDRDTVRWLTRKFSDTPRLAENSQPLLAYAVAWGDLDQCRFLLESGFAPDARLTAPAEPRLMKLVHGDLIRHYLETENGLTPLMLAAGMNRPDLVEALLQFKARPGAVTEKYRLAAVVFSAKTKDTASTLLLLGRKPSDATRDYVDISLASQTADVYLAGVHYLTTTVSTGRPGFETKPGEYVLTDKNLVHVSTIYKVKMPYFMRLSCLDFGMHEGYVPGYPDSHGCIRLPPPAARSLFKSLPVGTVVRVR